MGASYKGWDYSTCPAYNNKESNLYSLRKMYRRKVNG